jgi:hypothetical protein
LQRTLDLLKLVTSLDARYQNGESCDVELIKFGVTLSQTAEKKSGYIHSPGPRLQFRNCTFFTSPPSLLSKSKMCPHQNGDVLPSDPSEMVQVPLTNGHALPTNGKRGTAPILNAKEKRNPYAPRAADFLSNISNFNIIESTLRGTCRC